ncbi:probable serine/threonine-protein kinase DDB_G0278845 isoform X1 [Formica exsecta]|uniref:probable serine/threonine-protein kinase DDB_G0278845 isoform X1 n=1 Tax=Formica exsecta TaxID=72781 RepID=UPI0011446F88|nr:probable serine/threonine-protein kinase DDB_G0278845 isoform X1 [Formica exsecta]
MTRRITDWRNERPNKFSHTIATILNNNKDRNGNYIENKARRTYRDYDNMYVADLDYDSENLYDDFELSKDDSAIEYKDNYYTQFVNPRNIIGHSNQRNLSRNARYNYSKDPEFPFARSNRMHRREDISPRQWFDESDERNFREEDADIRSRRSPSIERKKRTKILSRKDENFNCEAEFGKARVTNHRERDDFSNAIDSTDNLWDSVSLENNASCEELTFTDPTKLKNRDGLQPKTSCNFVDSEREEESVGTRRKNDRENLSRKISTRSAKYQTSKSDAVKEKPKILNRIKSAKTSIDGRISNMNSGGKNSVNVRPYSAVEEKKIGINSPSEKRTETMNETFAQTNVDNRRNRVNKLSNETHQPTRTFKRIAESNSDEQIYATNEEDDTNPRSRNPRNNKINRTNVPVSRSAAEEKNERTFTLRMADASPRAGVETEKRKFFSRLPIRTWKRLRTKEPAALRLESERTIAKGDDNRKLRAVDIATTNLNDHLEKIKDDEIREEIRAVNATADRSDIKRSNRFGIKLLNADKPKTTSSNVKNIKGLKGLSTTKGTSEQQKKRMNIK